MAPLDPGKVDETRSWLHKASLDLRGLQIDRSADPPLLEEVLFHSQQLVEKSLKAFLCWHDRPFRKTHNLIELGEACVRLDHGLEPLLRKAAVLTEYAWKFRYPGDVEEPEEGEADRALGLAVKVFEEIKKRLPEETHPKPRGEGGSGSMLRETRAPYKARKTHGKGRKRK